MALPSWVLAVAGAVVACTSLQPPRWAELAIAGLMVLSLLWLLARYLRWVTTSFVVTNERLILRKGVLRRSGREILLDRLTDITYKQTLTDRLLRCGDILLESPGREGQEVFVDLPRPSASRTRYTAWSVNAGRPGASGRLAGAVPSPAGLQWRLAAAGTASGELARGTVTGSGRVTWGGPRARPPRAPSANRPSRSS